MRALVVLVGLALGLLVLAPHALGDGLDGQEDPLSGQDEGLPSGDAGSDGSTGDGGLGGDEDGLSDDADLTITSAATELVVASANPKVGSSRTDGDNPDAVAATPESWPRPNSSRCAEVGQGVIDPVTSIRPPICVATWVCGGERIDELVSGDIAGEDASGQYAAFLGQMIGFFGADVAPESGLGDVASVNSYLLDQGLADDHADDQIPVFYWCGKQPATGGPVVFEIVPTDPTRSPRFRWDTDIDSEYDIPALRADVLAELEALLGFYVPELGAVPPIDTGFTWVKWPTWLWVDSALDPEPVYAQSDARTLRLDMRAVVDRVEWTFGGEAFEVCTPDQMLAYNKQSHDPVADAPECSHRFTHAVQGEDLTATVFYRVEERVRRRNAKSTAYPDTPWVPHPDDPELQLSTTIPDYGVHEILSVNTPINMTDEEIAELLRNE